MGLISNLKSFISKEFLLLKSKIGALASKTFKVNVVNKVKDYSSDVEKVRRELQGIKSLVESVSKKELDLSELKKLDEITEAVKAIEFPKPKDVDFSTLRKGLTNVEKAVKGIKLPKNPEMDNSEVVNEIKNLQEAIKGIKIPKLPDIPSVDLSEVVKELKSLPRTLPKGEKIDLSSVVKVIKDVQKAVKGIPSPEGVVFPESIAVSNFPPTKTPQPVTNININPLRGDVHVTTTTVGTTLSKLPGYGELDSRRSLVFYNNSSTVTVFIGGSEVTSSNGIPVEPKAFSPSFDSGPLQLWYGITSSGSVDIRCVELANNSGG